MSDYEHDPAAEAAEVEAAVMEPNPAVPADIRDGTYPHEQAAPIDYDNDVIVSPAAGVTYGAIPQGLTAALLDYDDPDDFMDPDPAETGYIGLPAGTPGLDKDGDPPCPEAMIAHIRYGTGANELLDYDGTDYDEPDGSTAELDTASAAWALRKLRADEAEIDRCKLLAAAEFDRIGAWLGAATAARRNSAERLREALTGYHRVVLERDPHAKTIRFPHGTLKARQGQPRWSVDREAFPAWAERTGRRELLMYRAAPLLGMIKAALSAGALLPGADGQVVSPDGEPVPGLSCQPGQVNYRVDLEAVDHG